MSPGLLQAAIDRRRDLARLCLDASRLGMVRHGGENFSGKPIGRLKIAFLERVERTLERSRNVWRGRRPRRSRRRSLRTGRRSLGTDEQQPGAEGKRRQDRDRNRSLHDARGSGRAPMAPASASG